MELGLVLWTFLVLVGLAIFEAVRRFRKAQGSMKDVSETSLPSLPLVGHAMMFRGSRDELFERYSKLTFEKIIPSKRELFYIWLGPIPVLFIMSPRVAGEVLRSSQMLNKSYLYSFLHKWLGTGLLTAGGEKWKTRRRLLNPTFHSSILNDFLHTMNQQARIFVSKIKTMAELGETFDISKPVTLCSLDIICETAMGKSIHAQDNQNSDYVEAIYRVNEIIQERQKSPWLWPNFIFKLTKHGRSFAESLKVLHKFTRGVLKERMDHFNENAVKPGRKRMAFLDLLLALFKEGKISEEGVEEEVDTFMFAGHDTTATAISWALHLVGLHPEVQGKLVDELNTVFGDDLNSEITSDDISKLEYMDLVIKEALRMFPSVPVIGRSIDKKCEIDGRKIPAGTECIISPYAINNNQFYWKDPFKFNPERFRPENSKDRHPYAFLSFSAGPRNCIGQRFGVMEEKVVLAHFLRNYSIESCEKTEELRMLGDIILRSKNGIKVKIGRRK